MAKSGANFMCHSLAQLMIDLLEPVWALQHFARFTAIGRSDYSGDGGSDGTGRQGRLWARSYFTRIAAW